MIRICIAEDQQLLRGALISIMELEEDLHIAGEAADGREAWTLVEKEKPDVCILDIEMPHLSGLEVATKIRLHNYPCKIIIMTTFARAGYLQEAMDLDIDAYVLKDEPIEYVIGTVRKVMQNERVISQDLAVALFMNEKNPLNEREINVLKLVKDGYTTNAISKQLFLTKGTIRNYLSLSIQKLEVETRQQAVQKATEKGWI
ncbi:response regulator transcription factor [Lysinibacillus sp. SGAir0095]|uniref:response regulator transcription factor n=1 Tax=Lysinibacillus sp. SGAir0095 TaxID=2070463 RepID=UPI0010CCDC50|nr:response regulator transcription factor [Lysinibacillus sp. SGAir0095]QCR31129.1 DNA-binding response regulator [Lysinibacillus sp. SGAir0095]